MNRGIRFLVLWGVLAILVFLGFLMLSRGGEERTGGTASVPRVLA